jgi:hypothetical protein
LPTRERRTARSIGPAYFLGAVDCGRKRPFRHRLECAQFSVMDVGLETDLSNTNLGEPREACLSAPLGSSSRFDPTQTITRVLNGGLPFLIAFVNTHQRRGAR